MCSMWKIKSGVGKESTEVTDLRDAMYTKDAEFHKDMDVYIRGCGSGDVLSLQQHDMRFILITFLPWVGLVNTLLSFYSWLFL